MWDKILDVVKNCCLVVDERRERQSGILTIIGQIIFKRVDIFDNFEFFLIQFSSNII